jgi:hypothetical protein
MMDRRDLLAWALGLAAVRPNSPHGLPASRLVAIDRQVRAQFHYQQPTPHQSWDDAAAVIANQPWRGNCVTLAMTTLAMIKRAGSPSGTLYALLVLDAQYGGQHAVGLASDDLGRQWVVGDTFAQAYPYSAMRHRLLKEYRYS